MESLQFRKLKGSQGRVQSAVKLKSTAELHTRSKDYSRSTREEYEEQPLHFVRLKQGGFRGMPGCHMNTILSTVDEGSQELLPKL